MAGGGGCWPEICAGRCRWFQKALLAPRVPSSAFPGSSHCSEARCKGSCSRILPPSPSQVRKKPWVRGTEGLQAGDGLPLCAKHAEESLFSFFEVKTTHEAHPPTRPAPTQSPSIIPRPFGGGCHGDHKQNGMQINTARTTGEDGPREWGQLEMPLPTAPLE